MRLSDEERAMRDGAHGEARRWAIEQQIAVGEFFDAEDLVAITQVHIHADAEAVGVAGIEFLEKMLEEPAEGRRFAVPVVSDPRGADFRRASELNYDQGLLANEARLRDVLAALGVLMTDTCIVYQCVLPPVRGEHIAFGDTGSVIYSNSVCGARSNYEGGPAALAAAITGRTPRYGFHLSERRRGTCRYGFADPPRHLTDWGAIGALIGRQQGSYWEVPYIVADGPAPSSDALKHMGAAMASYGSTAMYHLEGVTPEWREGALEGDAVTIGRADIEAFYASFAPSREELDVVVFAAPQLSLYEMQQLAGLLEGRRVSGNTAVLVAVPPETKSGCDRLGLTAMIEASGAMVLEGVCFYQMHARELGEANGWRVLMSNSTKLVNIISGYGYEPVLASMRQCVESAVAGRIVR